MRIYLASDHAGFDAKNTLSAYLQAQGYEVEDCGPATLDPADDYPDFVLPCARRVAEDEGSFGVLFGASGEGEAMVANRVSGARALVYYATTTQKQTDTNGSSLGIIESARSHNNANIISFGARFLTSTEIEDAVKIFLATPFSKEERHLRRIEKF